LQAVTFLAMLARRLPKTTTEMRTLIASSHRTLPVVYMRNRFKRARALFMQWKVAKKDLAKADLFAGIYESDQFTLEQAYKDFAHIPLKSRSSKI
jgi:hypothetical protein